MDTRGVEAIIRALNQRQVRYLVIGGLAVVAHGYVRFTADLDLILALDRPNVLRAAEGLKALGYTPRAPVAIEQFADPENRRRWIQEKGLTVFSLFSPTHPATEVDLFVSDPLGFDEAYDRAARMEVAPGAVATFASLDDLIRLKKQAGRPRDLEDIRQLRRPGP